MTAIRKRWREWAWCGCISAVAVTLTVVHPLVAVLFGLPVLDYLFHGLRRARDGSQA